MNLLVEGSSAFERLSSLGDRSAVSVVLGVALLIMGGLHQGPAHGSGWWWVLVVGSCSKFSLTALGVLLNLGDLPFAGSWAAVRAAMSKSFRPYIYLLQTLLFHC